MGSISDYDTLEAEGRARTLILTAYALMGGGIVFTAGLASFLGLVIAYASRAEINAIPSLEGHADNIIRVFWGLALGILAFVAFFAVRVWWLASSNPSVATWLIGAGISGAGVLAMLLWASVRLFKGVLRAYEGRPYRG